MLFKDCPHPTYASYRVKFVTISLLLKLSPNVPQKHEVTLRYLGIRRALRVVRCFASYLDLFSAGDFKASAFTISRTVCSTIDLYDSL